MHSVNRGAFSRLFSLLGPLSFFSVPGLFSLYPGYRTTKGSKAPGAPCDGTLKLSGKSSENLHNGDSRYTFPLRIGDRTNLVARAQREKGPRISLP